MRRFLPHRHITAVAALSTAAASWALGVTGQPGAPAVVATAAFPYVGRVQEEGTPSGTHVGTGTLLNSDVVLTASHVVNTDSGFNNEQHFERFQLVGGQQIPALGIRNPNWNSPAGGGIPVNDQDIAIMLTLNMPNQASTANLVTPANAAKLAVGNGVTFLGYTGSANGGNPLQGTTTINAIGPGNLYTYDAANANNQDYIQAGDSGGPTFFNYGTVANPNWQLIGVHRSSSTPLPPAPQVPTTWADVQVAPYLSFIGGGGIQIGGAGPLADVLDRVNLNGTAGSWGMGTNWNRGAGPIATIPQANDVAVLDPSISSDVGTTVNLTAASANLDGMLTDVTLNINGATLSVVGMTGALNGGIINVGTNAGSQLTINYSLDNEGTLNVNNNGMVAIGASLGANTAGFENGFLNAKAVNVNGGGTFNVTNGNGRAIFLNNAGAMVNVAGDPINGNANSTIDYLDNSGGVSVGTQGTLSGAFTMINENGGQMTVSGAPGKPGTLNTVWLTNSTGGTVTANANGVINASRPALLIPGHSLDNNGTIQVNGGGVFNVAGRVGADSEAVFNNGNINIAGNLSPGSFQTNNGDLFNGGDGVIHFAGKVQSIATATFNNSNFITTGTVNGTGSLIFTGNSSYQNRAVTSLNPTLDTGSVSVIFNNASAGGSAVTMEAPTEDVGADISVLSDDPSSFYDFSIENNSAVKLVDNNDNSGSGLPEAIYTYEFGIDAGSTLDLHGLDLYYDVLDLSEGGLSGIIDPDGGELIQLPEPATAPLLGIAALFVLRRRRNSRLLAGQNL